METQPNFSYRTYDWYRDVQEVQSIMSWTIFVVFFIYNVRVLMYLKFKIGQWGYFTLFMHLIACVLRLFTPNFEDGNYFYDQVIKYYLINSSAQTLIWSSIYNFTFQILLVKSEIFDQTSSEWEKKIRFRRNWMISLMIIACAINIISWSIGVNDEVQQVITFSYIGIKLVLDTIIEVIFVKVAISMIKFKRDHSKLSCSNIKVLVFVSFVFAIILSQTWSMILQLIAYYWWQIKLRDINDFRDIAYFFIYPANDFLIAMSFTAIYYHQGKNEKEQESLKPQEIRHAINEDSDVRISQEIEEMLTDEAKQYVAQERVSEREKNLSKLFGINALPKEFRRSKVHKFLHDALTK